MPVDNNNSWLPANWPVPEWIHAGTTTRLSGYSKKPFDNFNLALHVGDHPDDVLKNRELLSRTLNLPNEPCWLNQVHGNHVIIAKSNNKVQKADGSYTNQTNVICAVLTADCVPLLLCNQSGTEIAAIHVGWRGFCKDIIKSAIHRFEDHADHIQAWLGPHISQDNYEIDDKVKRQLIEYIPEAAGHAFPPSRRGHCYANLTELVTLKLAKLGVTRIFFSEKCNYAERQHFYSYRREKKTGRMASMIWIQG